MKLFGLAAAFAFFLFDFSLQADEPLVQIAELGSCEAEIRKLAAQPDSKLRRLLSMRNFGAGIQQPSELVPPNAEFETKIVFQTESQAVLLISSNPETDGSRSEVALLVRIELDDSNWFSTSYVRFEATGKYARIEATQTASDRTGEARGTHWPAVFTITAHSGGRGYSSSASATYELREGKFLRAEIEKSEP